MLLRVHPFAPSRFESVRVSQCPGLRFQWIARLLCDNACNFSVGNGLRGCLLGPFQQRFRKQGLALVPALSSIDQTIGPPLPVRIFLGCTDIGTFEWPRLSRRVCEGPLLACAVQRRRFPVGATRTRQSLQPKAIGAVMGVTK